MLSVIIFIIIIISIFFIYNNNTKSEKIENLNITDNIDNLEIMERSPAYQNLIKKILSNKKEIFTKEEMDIMKNKFQFYDTEDGIKNITSDVLKETKNNNPENLTNEISITDNIFTNPAFNDILNGFQNTKDLDCKDVKVLQRPLYLNNYYYDMYGNKIEASLKDYINDYHIRIDNNNNEGQKVNIIKGKSNFIIPNQFDTLKYQTNAYNIDWNRIVNPMTTF